MMQYAGNKPFAYQCSACGAVRNNGAIHCTCGGVVETVSDPDEPCDTADSIERAESVVAHHVGRMILHPELRRQRAELASAKLAS